MNRKRSLEGPSETTRSAAKAKVVAARVSTAVVSVVSHHVPEEMCKGLPGYIEVEYPEPVDEEYFFYATGMILECQTLADANYLCTVLTPACLFKRPSHINLDEIQIDVFGSSGVSYHTKLLACDFHNNLALVQFISNSPLPTVTLSHLDVYHSVDPADTVHPPKRFQFQPHSNSFQFQPHSNSFQFQPHSHSFQFQPHSNSLKIVPGAHIFCVSRGYKPPFDLYTRPASLSSLCPNGFSCNELYEIKNEKEPDYPGYIAYTYNGGPVVVDSSDQIIGIYFNTSSFLPSNIVASWWSQYKSSRKFLRPFLGFEVANLHEADVDFLEQFITKFPRFSISTAVIVIKVEENSRACSGIHTNDIIVKLDGKLVKSRLQFFETIWEKTGQSVDFNVLRVTDSKELNVSFVIDEASPDKFHEWPHPDWGIKMVS